VPDQQQAPVRGHDAERTESLGYVEIAGERLVHFKARPLLLTPALGRQLRCLARTHARAEQHRVESRLQPRDGDARGARLLASATRQAPLGVRARAMGLGLGVPK